MVTSSVMEKQSCTSVMSSSARGLRIPASSYAFFEAMRVVLT